MSALTVGTRVRVKEGVNLRFDPGDDRPVSIGGMLGTVREALRAAPVVKLDGFTTIYITAEDLEVIA